MNKSEIIKKLNLSEHIEGGYFARTYCSPLEIDTNRESSIRPILTSIYYLLTNDRPIGHFHLNQSDIIHYFHSGSPITYLIIQPNGTLQEFIMGNDLSQNQLPQLIVTAGCWKASILKKGDYGLISEAVAPGFDYRDMTIGTQEILFAQFPNIWDKIADFVNASHPSNK